MAHYLLAKAIRSNDNPTKPPHEWSYHNISKLLPNEHKQWENAYHKELDMLQKCKVYEVIDHLKDWKVIQNQWVFNTKLDGWKKACLVVKGFSQVKGSDFDQMFSLVMHFETVQLMLGLAALED